MIIMNDAKDMSKDTPEDKKKFVYATFFWLGIGALLPWNMFICVSLDHFACDTKTSYSSQVSGYWNYKFRTLPENMEEKENLTNAWTLQTSVGEISERSR